MIKKILLSSFFFLSFSYSSDTSATCGESACISECHDGTVYANKGYEMLNVGEWTLTSNFGDDRCICKCSYANLYNSNSPSHNMLYAEITNNTIVEKYYKRYEPCESNQTRDFNNQCVDSEPETKTCEEGYQDYTSVGIGGLPNPCDECKNYDEPCEDGYTLFPLTEDSYQVCCEKYPTSNGGSDSNSTDNDSSSSSGESIDMTPTNSILDGIQSEIKDASTANSSALDGIKSEIKDASTANSSALDGVKTEIKDASTANSSALDDVKTEITSASTQAHNDALTSHGKNDELIQVVRSSISTDLTIGEQAHTDSENSRTDANTAAETAHNDSTDIKEAVEGLKDGDEEAQGGLDGVKAGFSNLSDSVGTGKDSILNSFNDLLSSYTDTPPTFTGSGNSTFSANVMGGSIVFDLSMFQNLRQYFDIVFALMLVWINFKIYRWIFEILLRIGV